MMVLSFKQSVERSQSLGHFFQGVFTDVLTHLCDLKVDMVLISQMRRQEPQKSERSLKEGFISIQKSKVV